MPMVLNIFFFFNTTKSVRFKSLNLQEMFCTIRKEYLVRHNLGIFAVQFEVINVQCNEYLMT